VCSSKEDERGQRSGKDAYIQCSPITQRTLCFWKVPRLRPIVLLVRETCKRKQVLPSPCCSPTCPSEKVRLYTKSRKLKITFQSEKRFSAIESSQPKGVKRKITERTLRCVVQGGSNMTGTDLCVNKPHCAAAVRP